MDQNNTEAKSLQSYLLETADTTLPKPSTLSESEKAIVALVVENKMSPLVKKHDEDGEERIDFDPSLSSISTAVRVMLTERAPELMANEIKKKAAVKLGRELASDWVIFVRNTNLLKRMQQGLSSVSD